jgi:hypothetical protein
MTNMDKFLIIIDKLLCGYFGFNNTETTPHFVKRKGKKLVILTTESFKRHTQEMPISMIIANTINKQNRDKLGMAVGKAIAENLTISFDVIKIKRDQNHAG